MADEKFENSPAVNASRTGGDSASRTGSADDAGRPGPAAGTPDTVTFHAPADWRIMAAVVGFGLWGMGIWLIAFAAFNNGSVSSAVWQTVVLAIVGTALCWWGMQRQPAALVVGPNGIDYGDARHRTHVDYDQLRAANCIVVKGTTVDHPAAPATLVMELATASVDGLGDGVAAEVEDADGAGRSESGVLVVEAPIRPARYTKAMTRAESITAVLATCAPQLCHEVEVRIDPEAIEAATRQAQPVQAG